MSIIVFAGSSIAIDDIKHHLPDADIRPPAKQGDIYIAVQEEPKIIALIDGFFERVPAVWHKEILYAMSRGIHVYGSSSMGALRAAELDSFGMIGVGEIYQQFTSGQLEDDDEVALIHAPAQLGYQPISRAMVDLRQDLQRAHKHDLLSQEHTQAIEKQLKSLWYPHRTPEALYQFAQPLLTEKQLESLKHFLGNNVISLKRQDALSLVKKLEIIDTTTIPAKQVEYTFNENDAWQTLINDVENEQQAKAANLFDVQAHLEKEVETDSKLRAAALAQAKQIGLSSQPWIQPAFKKIATEWQCIDEQGTPDFEKVSRTLHLLGATVTQFNQWVEREAFLLAYCEYTELTEEGYLNKI